MTIERFTPLQAENDSYRYSIDELKDEIRKRNEAINKMDLSIQSISTECSNK